ncbi:hypothetical protein VXQ18_11950, partial [Brucella abortus]|nr:hypothetical protein [Brucella abortus]
MASALVGHLQTKRINIESPRLGKVCHPKLHMRQAHNVEWWVKVRGRQGHDFPPQYVRCGDAGFECPCSAAEFCNRVRSVGEG